MRTTLSAAALEAMHSVSTAEVFLPLVKLSQAAWADSIRIVPNHEAITHGGEIYQPYAFDISLPDEESEGVPVLNFVADNVDRTITAAIRAVMGYIAAEVVWVLASSPDLIEIGPLALEMRAAEYDAFQISGTLGVEPILEAQFGTLQMNPKNAPALF